MNKIKTNLAVQTTLILFYSAFHFSIPIFIVLTFPFWIVPYLIASFMIKIRTMLTWISGLKGKIIRKLSEQQIGYAILKGNGKYLRTDDNKVLIYQLYDYTIRRFMSISHLQAQTKIIEIQSQSPSALLFLINHHNISQTYTINVLNSQPINHPKIVYLYNYQINNPKKMFDCVLLFEIKRKIQQNSSLDLIKIIEFIKYHMDPEGYIIFGDYFESGQLETFITLFKLYGLIIVDQEDLTKNIDYARRLRKIKKDCEISVLEWSKKLYHDWLVAEETNKKFNVMILQNDKYNRSK